MTGIPVKRGNLDTDTHTPMKMKADQAEASINQESQGWPANQQKLTERHGTDFSSQPSERINPVDTLTSDF